MGSDRKDRMYSKIMDAIGLIHAENLVMMEMIMRFHCREEDTVNEAIEKIASSWQEKWEDVRRW
jgi:hypothetical protein